ncbi:hypothetical protein D0962_10750 [Leptolyngbyaceae cyanobacterium CCMR0082]|uniref:Uncharacterized protein n=1 Tax=Adonisia turfae CCMR0082 TaxID=2304604 RepID=A0A6M0S4F2_9CYAN|nr:hypothetical protein [Adonisia turfae]NEZ63256.1 hypothetical protein [Adonisia turfae CCMR0082]
MDRVKSQAAVVSQLLFDPKTADTYKSVFVLTGTIIKELALLVWLIICSVFVFFAWFGDIALNSGQKMRAWWDTQQAEPVDGNQAAAATGQAFLEVSQNGANFLLDKAREQLGLEKIERPAKADVTVKSPAKAVAKNVSTTANAVAGGGAAVAKDAQAAVEKEAPQSKAASDTSVVEKH